MALVNTQARRLSADDRQRLETLLVEFDSTWKEGLLESRIQRLPGPENPLRVAALVELVKIDLERRWQAGKRPTVEAYLKRYPELGTANTVPADLLQAEHEVRRQFGEPASLTEFGRRFPAQVDELKRLIQQAREALGDSSLPAIATQQPSRASTHSVSQRTGTRTAVPEQFGRYRILRELGQGGMGAVYLAQDTQLDRQVALKVPNFSAQDGEEVLERFYREARAAATMHHPNLCPVHDVGEFDGVPYLTMAFIEGRPLTHFISSIKAGKPLPEKQVALLVRKIALALDEAHKKGIVHRDLKPANIMIDQRREPIIMDFGLARRTGYQDVRLTQSGAIMGTPAYMPPEQVLGELEKIGPRCDIYSLGVILYELLTGKLPFEGPVAAVLGQIIAVEPEPPSKHRADVDPQLEAICVKAMAKKLEARYASMAELAAELTSYLRNAPQTSTVQSSASMASEEAIGSAAGTMVDQSAAGQVRSSGASGQATEAAEAPQVFAEIAARERSLSKGQPRRPRRSIVRRVSSWWSNSPPKQRYVALGGGAAALLMLSIVITVATGKGVLKIESVDPHVRVAVLQGGEEVEIIDLETGSEVRLRSGQYSVALKGDRNDLKLSQNEFTLKRGGREIVRVEHQSAAEKAAEALPPPDAAETAAVIALIEKLGGKYRQDFSAPGKPIIEINLLSSKVRDDDLRAFAGQSQLQVLILGDTRISDQGSRHLKRLTNLERLDLGTTDITNASLSQLKGMSKLKRLELYRTTIRDEGVAHLAGLTELRILGLEGTGVGDAGLAHLKELTKLEALNLGATNVTDAGLDHLKGLTNLREFHVHGTKVTAAAKMRLQETWAAASTAAPVPQPPAAGPPLPAEAENVLLYDFSDPKQLDDFEIQSGQWEVRDGVLTGVGTRDQNINLRLKRQLDGPTTVSWDQTLEVAPEIGEFGEQKGGVTLSNSTRGGLHYDSSYHAGGGWGPGGKGLQKEMQLFAGYSPKPGQGAYGPIGRVLARGEAMEFDRTYRLQMSVDYEAAKTVVRLEGAGWQFVNGRIDDIKPQYLRLWTRNCRMKIDNLRIVWGSAAKQAAGGDTAGVGGGAVNPPPAGPLGEVTNPIGMKLVQLPAGEFWMGSAPDELDRVALESKRPANSFHEMPRHIVRITKPFLVGKHEVTQEEYETVMGTNPSHFSKTGRHKAMVGNIETKRYAVEGVSWDNAVKFCNALSKKEGLPPYYEGEGDQTVIKGGDGYRLMTEAEWEYACRAGTTTRWSFDDLADSLSEYAWFSGTGEANRKARPIGMKKPNPWGLHDMHGNVWEWVWDRWSETAYANSPITDPHGPTTRGGAPVIRGGSWMDPAHSTRSAQRTNLPPWDFDNVGFRVARTASVIFAAAAQQADADTFVLRIQARNVDHHRLRISSAGIETLSNRYTWPVFRVNDIDWSPVTDPKLDNKTTPFIPDWVDFSTAEITGARIGLWGDLRPTFADDHLDLNLVRHPRGATGYDLTIVFGRRPPQPVVREPVWKSNWNVKFYNWNQAEHGRVPDIAKVEQGPVLVERELDHLDLNWWMRPVFPGVPRDWVALTAERSFTVPAGKYRVATVSDDGVRVLIDGEKILENWRGHTPQFDTAVVDLTDGDHTVRVEHFEVRHTATLAFWIRGATGVSPPAEPDDQPLEPVGEPEDPAAEPEPMPEEGFGDYEPLLTGQWVPILKGSGTGVVTKGATFSDGVLDVNDGYAVDRSIQSKDMIIRAKVKKQSGENIRLSLRGGQVSSYTAWYAGNNEFGLSRNYNGNFTELKKTKAEGIADDDFFEFAFAIIGDALTVYADGTLVLEARDARFGNVGWPGVHTTGGRGSFKDVEVQILEKPAAAIVQPARLPVAPAGSPLRFLGYVIHDSSQAIEQVAGYTSIVLDRGWLNTGDATLLAARRAGLPVVLTFHNNDRKDIEDKLYPLVEKYRDVVAGVCWDEPYYNNATPADLTGFGNALKKQFPGLSFWVSFVEKPRGRHQTLPVPFEVDVLVVNNYFDTTPQAIRAKTDDALPNWMGKANNRPVLLRWLVHDQSPAGLVRRTEPAAIQACFEAASKHRLSGVLFDHFGERRDKMFEGIDTKPALVKEIQETAEKLGFVNTGKAATGFQSLFNGKDLSGWSADALRPADQWSVEGETIVGRSQGVGSRSYLLTDKEFADFVLRFDFRVEDDTSHGGVAIRAIEGEKVPQQGGSLLFDHPMIKLTNPTKNETDPTGMARWLTSPTSAEPPAERLPLPTGNWYSMEVVVRGDRCTATVGGKKLVEVTLDPKSRSGGPIVPGLARSKGKIGFQVHTGAVRYRNIEIQELPPGQPSAAVTPPAAPAEQWTSLFTGKDLSGWTVMKTSGADNEIHQPGKGGWNAQNDTLLSSSGENGWLKSEKQYGDFVLQLEFRLRAGANSGVYIRSPGDGHLSRTGIEIQVFDESSSQANIRPDNRSGAVWGVAGPNASALKPLGQWNEMEIRCQGDQVQVTLNGVETANVDMNAVPALRGRPRSGFIGLSNWRGQADGVALRNIRIREL